MISTSSSADCHDDECPPVDSMGQIPPKNLSCLIAETKPHMYRPTVLVRPRYAQSQDSCRRRIFPTDPVFSPASPLRVPRGLQWMPDMFVESPSIPRGRRMSPVARMAVVQKCYISKPSLRAPWITVGKRLPLRLLFVSLHHCRSTTTASPPPFSRAQWLRGLRARLRPRRGLLTLATSPLLGPTGFSTSIG